MAKKSKDAYGAAGQSNLLFFDPDVLVLVEDPKHPLYDKRVHLPLDEAMIASIMMSGVAEPIMVLKNPETGVVEVVFGRQRVKNAREANRRLREQGRKPITVPGFTRKGLDQRTAAALMASENAIRQEETPMGRARMMQQLVGLSYTEADLAIIFGCSLATVRDALSLLECTKAVQDAVEAGQIRVTHAKALARLDPPEQRAKVSELIAAGDGARPHERARRQRAVLGESKPRMRTRREVEQELEAAVGERAQALRWVLNLELPAEDGAVLDMEAAA